MIARRTSLALVPMLLAACAAPPAPVPAPLAAPAAAPAAMAPAPHVVEVTAEDYAFSAPAAIPSGWTTIRFANAGEEPHMVLVSRLPEGKTVDDYEAEMSVPFSEAWYSVRDGRATADEALATLFGALPEWFPLVQFVGGPGLVAPGRASEVTMNLAPGDYVLECYVKTEAGEIHYMDGMVRPITVLDTPSGALPPAADVRITLSNAGMAVDGDLTRGRRTIAVHAAQNPEVGFGHSLHLARLEPGTDVAEVVRWMNWFELDGLRHPAPARFVGGVHPMPTGHTAYFTADLEPGRYLAVSEATGAQGVLREFTVR